MIRPEFRIERASDGSWYWRLLAVNGETLGVSELFTRREDARRGAKTAKRAASWASVEK